MHAPLAAPVIAMCWQLAWLPRRWMRNRSPQLWRLRSSLQQFLAQRW